MVRGLETIGEELRRALRTLSRRRTFTCCVIALLAVTIGTVTALGTAAYELLRGPLPYGSPDRLMLIWSDRPKSGYLRGPLSGPEVNDLRERSRTLTQVAAIFPGGMPLEDPLESGSVSFAMVCGVTGNFFDLVRAAPALGRVFRPEDEGNDTRVVLSWGSWQNRFGGDPAIIGRRVRTIDGTVEIIGVMPASFRMVFPPDTTITPNPEAWYLLQAAELKGGLRYQYGMRVLARLRDDATPAAAANEVEAIGTALEREFPGYAGSGRRLSAVALTSDLVEYVRRPAVALVCIGAFLVLIVHVNLAALWIARAAAQAREFGIQLALGASAARVRASLAVPIVLLSAVGSACGLVLGAWGLRVLRSVRPASLSRIDAASLTWPLLLALLAIVAVSTLFLTLLTLASVRRLGLQSALRTHGEAGTRYRLRSALVIVQLALVVVFLAGSLLAARSFWNVLHTDIGFVPDGLLTFKYPGPPGGPPAARDLYNTRLRESVRHLPGVTAVGSISHLPFDGLWHRSAPYVLEGEPDEAQRDADARIVSPGFVEALGARLIDGRAFEERDGPAAPPVIIVDRHLAERVWPGQSAVGKRLRVSGFPGVRPMTPVTIVGVIEHMRYRTIESDVREQIYFPIGQNLRGPYGVLVRASGDLGALMTAIPQRVREVMGQTTAIWDVKPLRAYYDEAAAERRFTALLLVIFAGASLVLAAIGVYGLLSYIVAGRRNEFAVRMALGAERPQVVRAVLRESLRWTALGVAIGGLLVVPNIAIASRAFYGVAAWDPLSWGAALLLVFVTVALASWAPAFRAGSADPATLFREQ